MRRPVLRGLAVAAIVLQAGCGDSRSPDNQGAAPRASEPTITTTTPDGAFPKATPGGVAARSDRPQDGADTETSATSGEGGAGATAASRPAVPTEVGRGFTPTGVHWALRVDRADGRCLTWTLTTEDGRRSGGSGCDYRLPIDQAGELAPGYRLVVGPVTAAAARVRVEQHGGESFTVDVVGKETGFGHGFYGVGVLPTAPISRIVAIGPNGEEVARLERDRGEEEAIIALLDQD